MVDLSVVIPAYNESEDLPNLVNSIKSNLKINFEIVVVDNGSNDGTGEIARQLGCQVVQSPNPMYPSQARNIGARSSRSPVLAFLDADVIVTPQWAREVERVICDDNFLRGSSVMGESCRIPDRPSWIEKYWFQPLARQGRKFLNGANMIISRSAFDAIGGFNPHLETGEDVDFSERAMQEGVSVDLNPELVVYHEGFPKNLRSFFRRERWHGLGDFTSWTYFLRSKVAQITALVGCCYLAILILLPFAWYDPWDGFRVMSAACAAAILALCSLASLAKFWKAGIVSCAAGVVLYFVYFNARLVSMFDAWRSDTRAGCSDVEVSLRADESVPVFPREDSVTLVAGHSVAGALSVEEASGDAEHR
ncbi:glycosyltransferase [Gilvimarinus sp. F26214L]|uniref:glycosyltransferase n=1 Tax=Gilvimarinus sp. DZF01 TaxID=3461371 RepID=UPI0040466DE4